MSTQSKTFLTPEQYLEIERKAEYTSEYYGGEMFVLGEPWQPRDNVMAHDALVVNLNRELHAKLADSACCIVEAAVGHARFDAVGVRGQPRLVDDQLLNPALLVDVVLPSTEAYDRGRKFEKYQTIDSLREYLMVASDRVSADLFTRQADGRWLLTSATRLEDSVELQSIGCSLTLGDLYEKVIFVEAGAAPAPQA